MCIPDMTIEVKICGLTDAAAVDTAIAAGADYVGFVFFPKSPRHLRLEQARELVARARGASSIVALMVDPDDALVAAVVGAVAPDFLQLHGSETPQRVSEIKQRTGCRVIKAVKVATKDHVTQAQGFAAVVDLMLYDAKPPEGMVGALPGGNGLTFDWRLLEAVAPGEHYMLSGGLDVGNIAEAVRLTNAPAVDVSSGVEAAPGHKDPELIRRFVAAAKTIASKRQGKADAHV